MSVTPRDAEQACELLGLSTWRVGGMLRQEAQVMAHQAATRIGSYESLNVGEARALLRAAEACEKADDMLRAAVAEEVESSA